MPSSKVRTIGCAGIFAFPSQAANSSLSVTGVKPLSASHLTCALSSVGGTNSPGLAAPGGASAITWYIRIGTGSRKFETIFGAGRSTGLAAGFGACWLTWSSGTVAWPEDAFAPPCPLWTMLSTANGSATSAISTAIAVSRRRR